MNVIICGPYERPEKHFELDGDTWRVAPGWRPSVYYETKRPGYVKKYPLKHVDEIRAKVLEWRDTGYQGATKITKMLLRHWNDAEARPGRRLFFCQLVAAETIIWLNETEEGMEKAADIDRSNLDRGNFMRLCSKMATGTGKTVVMAMLIAWQVLNALNDPSDNKYTRRVLVVTPGKTVRSRLQVLKSGRGSYYDTFNLMPPGQSIGNVDVTILNWHKFNPQEDESTGVDKRGPRTPQELAFHLLRHRGRTLVINDEAHHAWRAPHDAKNTRRVREATQWMKGLDKINQSNGITQCLDFTATPLMMGGKGDQEMLFDWVVSDFSLNDAIEAGMVKTPQIDRSKEMLYRIPGVGDFLNGGQDIPPALYEAFRGVANEWRRIRDEWMGMGSSVPPVFVTFCNSTRHAKRIEDSFRDDVFGMEDLADESYTIRLDTTTEDEERREKANTAGVYGKPGQDLRNIVSVGMLSEGWDVKTVKFIVGLRAFSSQLLCEQVLGRGLRRVSYDLDKNGRFLQSDVVVLGVPFSMFPHTTRSTREEDVIRPETEVGPDNTNRNHTMYWPHCKAISVRRPVQHGRILPCILEPPTVKPAIQGGPIGDYRDFGIDERARANETLYDIAYEIREPGSWESFAAALDIVQSLEIVVPEDIPRGGLIQLNKERIIRHIRQNAMTVERDMVQLYRMSEAPLSTEGVTPYSTILTTYRFSRTHFGETPFSNRTERRAAEIIDSHPNVVSWFKNSGHGLLIDYTMDDTSHTYIPDFLIRLRSGVTLILEYKGDPDEESVTPKREALERWVRVVNEDGSYGAWDSGMVVSVDEVYDILSKSYSHMPATAECIRCHKSASDRDSVTERFGFTYVGGVLVPNICCLDCAQSTAGSS